MITREPNKYDYEDTTLYRYVWESGKANQPVNVYTLNAVKQIVKKDPSKFAFWIPSITTNNGDDVLVFGKEIGHVYYFNDGQTVVYMSERNDAKVLDDFRRYFDVMAKAVTQVEKVISQQKGEIESRRHNIPDSVNEV